MTSKKRNPHDQGELIAEAASERRDVASTISAASLKAERSLAPRGLSKPIAEADIDDALVRIAHGEPMSSVTERIGINRSALLVRAHNDEDFRLRLRLAQEAGAFAIVENTLKVAQGEAGFSTGSIERDKLVCDVAWKWGKTIGNRIFGDKLQVDQRSITITIDRDSSEW